MRLVVVGGVAGGMSCAARARRLDETAEIVVLEQGPDVSVASCGLPYHLSGEIADEAALRVQTPQKLLASLNLDVRTSHEVTAVDPASHSVTVSTPDGVEEITYDALVLSPGARAVTLPVPGADSPRVSTLRTVEDARELRAEVLGGASSAVVIGAGFIGVEAAENLREAGLAVTLVEAAPHVLPPLETEMASLAREELRRLGVDVRESHSVSAIHPGADHDIVELGDGTRIDAQIIISSIGVRARTELAQSAGARLDNGAIAVDAHGRTSVPGIWAVGDAVTSTHAVTGTRRPVALAGPANRAGRQVADDIIGTGATPGQWRAVDEGARVRGGEGAWASGHDEQGAPAVRPLPDPLATAIVRVGELEVAMTGANRRDLLAAGFDPITLHLHPSQHVGYFPGAQRMDLVVHIDSDGRILGAQGVGRDGVARRIDVLATAMRAGMTAPDLIDLDLSYSPPYGAAKDAVNMIGMNAENVLDGMLPMWYPWELEERRGDSLILDVRSHKEAASGIVPGALVIPHTELRGRLEEVRRAAAGRPIAIHCQSGVRSYLAHCVLRNAGMESSSLSGGMLTLRAWLGDRADEVLVDPAI